MRRIQVKVNTFTHEYVLTCQIGLVKYKKKGSYWLGLKAFVLAPVRRRKSFLGDPP